MNAGETLQAPVTGFVTGSWNDPAGKETVGRTAGQTAADAGAVAAGVERESS